MTDPIKKITDYYGGFNEKDRLESCFGQIEFVRSQQIIARYLPGAPSVILDVGGAAGRYSCWLAGLGYEVHLIDPVPKHLEQAKQASVLQKGAEIASCSLGDARQLPFRDSFADALLLMGPLYHLGKVHDRIKALKEAYRVLKKGGVLFAVIISRYASAIDGLHSGYYKDPEFREIMQHDLKDGQHRNPTGNELYFTDAYFQHPQELRSEIEQAGFQHEATIGIEGISYMMRDLDVSWNTTEYREFLLDIIQRLECEPTLIGASPHIMAVAYKN
ncbi:MAG: methyltransferase domain-containing protein [Spirochaetales bacterium]|nr:methyltransferase domain-containing protein [Spirochaetales bacterium]